MPKELEKLTRSEWELILNEACYSPLDEDIVRHYIMKGLCQIDVGGELDRTRQTIHNHLRSRIFPRAQEVATKLNII